MHHRITDRYCSICNSYRSCKVYDATISANHYDDGKCITGIVKITCSTCKHSWLDDIKITNNSKTYYD